MIMLIATWNMGDGPDAVKRRDLDRLLASGVTVICVQEAGDRGDLLESWAKAVGWKVWSGRVPGGQSVSILYRGYAVKRLSRVAVPRMYVGAGAGPSTAKAKAIVGVRFGKLVILNTHMVASATRKGRRYRLRRAHYALHMTVLVVMVRLRQRRGLQVVVTGDMNGEESWAGLRRLRGLLDAPPTGPTHESGRRIDMVWGADAAWTVGTSSDHEAVVARV